MCFETKYLILEILANLFRTTSDARFHSVACITLDQGLAEAFQQLPRTYLIKDLRSQLNELLKYTLQYIYSRKINVCTIYTISLFALLFTHILNFHFLFFAVVHAYQSCLLHLLGIQTSYNQIYFLLKIQFSHYIPTLLHVLCLTFI